MPSGGGGSSTTTITPAPPSPQEIALQERQLQLAELQIELIGQSREDQQALLARLEPELQRLEDLAPLRAEFEEAQLQQAFENLPLQQELQDLQLEDLRRGGAASPEQLELIGTAVENAIGAGESDISRFQEQSLRQLREELAPSRGLRPTDTPIQDRGFRLAEEAQRQQGQLVSGLREAEATASLNFPLAQQQVIGAQLGFQQQLAQAAGQFQSDLTNQAFINRLQAGAVPVQIGAGLASGLQPNIAGTLSALAQQRGGTSTTSTSGGGGFNLGSILGGAGSLLSGGAAVFALSSRDLKENNQSIDNKSILAALRKIPVEAWNYIGDGRKHIGTYAEDFREAFGVGDGKTINLMDAVGVLMAAVQELAEVKHAAA